MNYKPSRCPDCGSSVQMCCCQAWAKNSQSDKLEKDIDEYRTLKLEHAEMKDALEKIMYQTIFHSKAIEIAQQTLEKIKGDTPK